MRLDLNINMKNKLENVIITGGAGFIGSNLITKLLENGTKKILVIDDLSTGKLSNLNKFYIENNQIEILQKRIEDINDLDKTFAGYIFCFQLAAGCGVQYILENVHIHRQFF